MNPARGMGGALLVMYGTWMCIAGGKQLYVPSPDIPFGRLLGGVYLIVLGVIVVSELPLLGAGTKGLIGALLLALGVTGFGVAIDDLVFGEPSEVGVSVLLAVLFTAVAVALFVSGRRGVLQLQSQQPNQPLHHDAPGALASSRAVRAGERRR